MATTTHSSQAARRSADRPVAGAHHGRQVWTFNTGGILTDPDKDVPADYEWLCGCVLGDPSTNNCGVLQDVLASATRQALTTKKSPVKLAGFYEVIRATCTTLAG